MTLREQLQTIVQEKHLLNHPFYVAWTEGKLTRSHLKHYAIQYFQNVLAFPTYLSAVHFNTVGVEDAIGVRQEILENLIEEERGDNNHPALWRRFAESLDATDAELTETAPLSTTHNLIDTFRRLCLQSPFYAGLAALFAYESQIPEIAGVKIDGLRQFYGMTNSADYLFFTVHQKADVLHTETELKLIEQYADSPEKEAEVLAVAREATDALWGFLDGVYETYCADVMATAA
ncbi:CADD family putative folate metabolism protein [Leptolyngbya sp. FACHB-36]|uniref:CADD family putative folate metabolism protein n=1 Tax=Leptolyngbya sp. FACHB-36 TaxID=2692808 RepID=UPI001680C578|nr:CADD family putative folate metabolism protein [Leptolyngbya sp. FACHB-36]MBD2019987.1 CADD family putative folate metabolism protein [Leptolyngbya sp. FACHB-36]